MEYIYGPVPSRRLGISLGISPIPKKTCNYSCVYCQLGRTDKMTNKRRMFFAVEDIIKEFELILKENIYFDVITIVGEGEPTLYLGLGELILEMKKRTSKTIAIITNGALLYDPLVRKELSYADIVLPTLDAYDDSSFKTINRPIGSLTFNQVLEGLKVFSKEYQGLLWLEMMFIKDVNDDLASLNKYTKILDEITYDKLYINTPVRPPAEGYIKAVTSDKMSQIVTMLNGISIALLDSEGFYSDILDHYEAILSIIKRHPMNQYEISTFLATRKCNNIDELISLLKNDNIVEVVSYRNYNTFRLK
jgi:wyosine [tRNA(Phe)-imidazoG37] synthetase (radical SAM superfamily)